MANCPNCGNQTSEGAVFCDQCGTRLPAPETATIEAAPAPAGGSVICPACGAGNVPGEGFCDFCGTPLEAPVPTAEAVPELEPVSAEGELEVTPEPATEEAEEEVSPVDEPVPAAPPAAEAPVPSAVEGEAPAAEEPVPVEKALTCPACGAAVQPDEAFCADCGASLAQPPLPPEEAAPEPAPEVQPEPVAEAPPEPAVEEAPPPAAAPACPACGAEIETDDTFCSNCGAALTELPVVEEAPVAPPALAGPRIVISASGAEIPLPAAAEILVGREDPVSGVYPDVDLTPHGGEEGGVSRRHAQIIVEGGNYFVEDLDSTNFTFVNKQKLAPRTRQPLSDGDEIRCGRVAFVLRY